MGETSSKPAERIRNVLYKFPPISHVLAMKGCPEVIDNLNNCLKYKRVNAIEHIGNMLSDLGLDNITRAFKKAVEEDMICRCCAKQVKLIDELCCCPGSAGRCHCTGCCSTLPSSQDVLFPPISQVLAMNGRSDLIDCMNNCLKYKNTTAIKHTVNMLTDLGLDQITIAFEKAVEENMICYKCKKQTPFNALCYCPELSGTECHDGTGCCDTRKIKGLTSGLFLFPPISQVLISNGCPHLLDSLNNGLKYKNTKTFEHIGTLFSDRGLDHITRAFKKAAEENLICHRCEKQIKFINELCYCPKDSGEKCHHGTSCCDNRKIKAWTSGH